MAMVINNGLLNKMPVKGREPVLKKRMRLILTVY